MKKTLLDLVRLLFPLGPEKKHALTLAAKYLDPEQTATLRYYLKLNWAFAVMQQFATPLVDATQWPLFKSHRKDKDVDTFLEIINAAVETGAHKEVFLQFAPSARQKISGLIAPNIVGMDAIKQAVTLQLFSQEPLNVLLLGDPGTGKTDILRSLSALAPISSFGLGSGTSGAGLSAMAKGDTVIKGLLPMADGGIACIDELNLMKAKDAASLYNAMEKGFVTYDKGGKHEQLPARVRVCATANPQGDSFAGRSAEVLKKQIPFDDALLSRFHLLFIIRKATAEEFEHIAKNIVAGKGKPVLPKETTDFVKAYVQHAAAIEVTLDTTHERHIVAFIKQLKEDERHFLVEVGPRTVVGVVRIVKAVARAELSQAVDQSHLDAAFAIVRDALYVRKNEQGAA